MKRAKPEPLHRASYIFFLRRHLHLILLSPSEVGFVMGPPSQMSYQDSATALLQAPCAAWLQICVFPNCICLATYLPLQRGNALNVNLIFKLSLKLADALHGKSQENLTSETGKGQAGAYGYNWMVPE